MRGLASMPNEQPVSRRADHAPMVVTLDSSAIHDGEVALRMTIDGDPNRFPGRVDLAFALPEGVTLAEPETASTARVGETRTIRLRLAGGVPARDVTVTAKMHGDGFGVTSRASYRFGREAPRLATPKLPDIGLRGSPR